MHTMDTEDTITMDHETCQEQSSVLACNVRAINPKQKFKHYFEDIQELREKKKDHEENRQHRASCLAVGQQAVSAALKIFFFLFS